MDVIGEDFCLFMKNIREHPLTISTLGPERSKCHVNDDKSEMDVLRPLACLLPTAVRNAALVILNQPLEKQLFQRLWACSAFRACTDGGTDRLYQCVESQKETFIPDVITGDFDSASQAVLNFYKEKNVPIIGTPDQDETDFTKCLRITVEKTRNTQVEQFLVMGSMGGRQDHHYANIATLFTAATFTTKPIYLMAEGNVACLLRPGKTVIQADTGLEDNWCGLIPIGQRCHHVTTSGLKWNLDNQALAFGELVSSSNAFIDKTVVVETDQPLLWNMGYLLPSQPE